MTVIARFEVIPIREGSMAPEIAQAISALDSFDVSYETTATDTIIEADSIDEIFAAVQAAHSAIRGERVITSVEIDDQRGRPQHAEERVASVEHVLGRPARRKQRPQGTTGQAGGQQIAGRPPADQQAAGQQPAGQQMTQQPPASQQMTQQPAGQQMTQQPPGGRQQTQQSFGGQQPPQRQSPQRQSSQQQPPSGQQTSPEGNQQPIQQAPPGGGGSGEPRRNGGAFPSGRPQEGFAGEYGGEPAGEGGDWWFEDPPGRQTRIREYERQADRSLERQSDQRRSRSGRGYRRY